MLFEFVKSETFGDMLDRIDFVEEQISSIMNVKVKVEDLVFLDQRMFQFQILREKLMKNR